MAKARQLVREVKSENKKKILLYVAVFIAAAIGFAAFIAGTFFTCGALPFILCAISAGIYLFVAGCNLYSQMRRSDLEVPGSGMPTPVTDIFPVFEGSAGGRNG